MIEEDRCWTHRFCYRRIQSDEWKKNRTNRLFESSTVDDSDSDSSRGRGGILRRFHRRRRALALVFVVVKADLYLSLRLKCAKRQLSSF